MNLQQIFLILWARYKLVLLLLMTTVVAATVMASTFPPRYKASTTLVIDFKTIDPITGSSLPVQLLLSSYLATEIDILESLTVARKVVKALRLADDDENKRKFLDVAQGRQSIEDWLAAGLMSKLEVKPSKESRIIEVNFTSPDPEYSASVANAFAQAYVQTNLEMKVAPARESATWFDTQLAQLRTQLDTAQANLTKYQTEKGITSTDRRLDVEVAKLAEISSQLVQAEALAYESGSRQRQLQEFIAKDLGMDSLPEVLSSPVIHELKARLSAAETRLSQVSNTFGVNHPEYQRAQSEVNGVRKKLRDEVNTAASVIGNNLRIIQGRERELRDAAAAQKARLLGLNRNRDELGALMKEVENAQRAYDSASQRYTQTSLESRMDQSNVTVLVPAIAPAEPSFPRWPLVIAFAGFVGLLLGVGLALVAEMIDRRVRGTEDLVEAVGTEAWGVLANTTGISKEIERRRKAYMKHRRPLAPIQEPRLE